MNVVVLVGRLVRDPELRYTNSQMPICNATLAVRRMKEGNDGKDADFIRIVIFGKQAETFNQYLTKGREVAIEGRLNTGSYQNQKGDTVYTTDVIVSRFHFIGNKGDGGNYNNRENYGGNNYNTGGYGGESQGGNYSGHNGPTLSGGTKHQNIPEGFSEIDEDDIPF